jgi:hypothetical protein
MAPRRVHVVSKHVKEVNQNHFPRKKKDLNLTGRARVKGIWPHLTPTPPPPAQSIFLESQLW